MIPLSLTLTGFLSYRDTVEIDFTQFDLACISGANGAGKSSLLDAMTWALFGQARKRDESLIHSASPAAEVALIFEYEGNVYRVQRTLPRGKTSLLEFHILQGEWRTENRAIVHYSPLFILYSRNLETSHRTGHPRHPGPHRTDPAPRLRYLHQRQLLPARQS